MRLAVLGSTGSIGTQTLDVARLFPDRLTVTALAANRSVDAVEAQAREFGPAVVVMGDEGAARELTKRLKGTKTRVEHGPDALDAVAA
jgi:1-deoxy-D-xylulose-5-phosphate reductoisomerase